nr:MAG TPA: DNA methylase [Caudoviricetes sp.]
MGRTFLRSILYLYPMPEKARTLNAMHDQQAILKDSAIRRLTPKECCRLQGFPDGYGSISTKADLDEGEVRFWNDVYKTHQRIAKGRQAKEKTKKQLLGWYNKLHTDSAEYKMWGNGIALPPAVYVMSNIVNAISVREEQ